jgi:hypothetical protein
LKGTSFFGAADAAAVICSKLIQIVGSIFSQFKVVQIPETPCQSPSGEKSLKKGEE